MAMPIKALILLRFNVPPLLAAVYPLSGSAAIVRFQGTACSN